MLLKDDVQNWPQHFSGGMTTTGWNRVIPSHVLNIILPPMQPNITQAFLAVTSDSILKLVELKFQVFSQTDWTITLPSLPFLSHFQFRIYIIELCDPAE